MNIAVLGSGGREHAIVWKLAQHAASDTIYALPGNGGIPNSVAIDSANFGDVEKFCHTQQIDLIIVGPEAPLTRGIVDHFADAQINVFGPSQQAARLEGSKIWAKQFMARYGVATADFWVFDQGQDASRLIHELQGDLVLKYDGLAGGKGVYVCSSEAEAMASQQALHTTYGTSAPFLIEKKLTGAEISIIGFTDGKHIQLLMPSQDHKQLNEGDTGPNTGGMGAYCPPTFYDETLMTDIMTAIVNPTLQGLQEEQFDYKGAIYFGIMITDDGPQLLEYNVRLGDPEAEVILPALKSDLLQLILSCFDGTLPDYPLEFHPGYFVDVVLVSGGYPGKYTTGYEIRGLDKLSPDTLVFHAGTALQDGKLVADGGRVLNIVAHGDDLASTVEKVYQECQHVEFDNMYYRKDIGKRNLL
ncbi:phosphoribosylamine--glycine ligase [candidate division KSB3 bacterium]|uniref:Phosphoribosylamine--glycine ligase n=1 Tax=candidate division KSB3 bacterium TaxID=2044937 RepID=A0A9D5JSS3_9BACT|nr:phosphoribosylamine--glycine ligase [candidate division KSB3 bacterium]MBD3323582.1 phosphoribosylamine--glycine ligase [candidate division KSB3 bacterium]